MLYFVEISPGSELAMAQLYIIMVQFIVDNCIDRHAEAAPDRTALIWEKDEPNQHQRVSYR